MASVRKLLRRISRGRVPSLGRASLKTALSRRDPIRIETRPGDADDRMDLLPLIDGKNPSAPDIVKESESDPTLTALVDTYHLRGTSGERLEAYYEGGMAQSIANLMSRFGIGKDSSIADMGCGIGWLAYSLDRMGYTDLTAMDPSDDSTNHLKSVAGERIEIINDLDIWRAIRHRFDALVSVATVHHWEHIPWIALEARRTMKPGAYWFAVMEWFADTPTEFVEAMSTHPTRERYKMYEWAYPASAYVDLIQSVGLSLVAVVPDQYRNNSLLTVGPKEPATRPTSFDRFVDDNLTGPNGTVEMFWAEVDARRRSRGRRQFTRPQVLVFQRTTVD